MWLGNVWPTDTIKVNDPVAVATQIQILSTQPLEIQIFGRLRISQWNCQYATHHCKKSNIMGCSSLAIQNETLFLENTFTGHITENIYSLSKYDQALKRLYEIN